ncbi:CbiX/SirB N-terminal domain-containing protein [Zhihengliuella sp.]|uniref:sirohydrochlorin chelatase n=1 Tax=Zhihengliuella sp. TaxID=1954483 RepID=UPI002811DBA2|nr:CbiX/SirB N-terminal domain-containing protein [Zhihengliuella sp.]
MIDRLRAGVDDRLQGEFAGSALRVRVHEAYVDVQEPRLGEVLAGLPAGEWALVLPMLVCDGVHTVHDIADAVAQRPGTEALPPIAAGPTAAVRLAQGLAALVPAGPDSIGADSTAADPGGAAPGLPATVGWCPAPEPPAVVLAVAGTRRPEGQAQAQRLAELVSAELGSRVEAAFCSAAEPRIGDAVARHRDAGRDVVVLSVLLGEGYFQDRLRAAGAQYVSPPLLSPAASSAAMLTECLAETVLEGVRESRS